MCAALIGGMNRLKRDYIEAAQRQGVRLKVLNGTEGRLGDKFGTPDLIIICTNKVSHAARNEAMAAARSGKVPVLLVHRCGVTALRDCLSGGRP